MRKFPIAHYQKNGSTLFINGGTLIVTDTEYRIKSWFRTVARFPRYETVIAPAPSIQLYEGFTFTHNATCLHLYFFTATASALRLLLQETNRHS